MKAREKNQKQLIVAILAVITLILITIGLTYAFFNYAKQGSTENSITSGSLSFQYTENSKIGKGILLEDALPMSDSQGKIQSGEGKVFEFTINSKSGSKIAIPYEVTARKSSDSTLAEDVVKLYLEKGNEEVLLKKYSELSQTSHQNVNNYVEKVIYNGKVPKGENNYSETFKLRMWIDEGTDYSNGTYNDKTFKITVNVYANGKMLTEEDINLEKSTSLTNLNINNGQSVYEEGTTNYNMSTTDKEITINATPKNSLANVQITKTDSTYENVVSMNNKGIVPIAASNKYTLTTGEHYFKIVVTPEDTSVEPQEYHLHVTKLPSTINTLSSLSITECPLDQSFDSDTLLYTCTTSSGSLTINATPTDSEATAVPSGHTSLTAGNNTVTVTVTPESGTPIKTYTITVYYYSNIKFSVENNLVQEYEKNILTGSKIGTLPTPTSSDSSLTFVGWYSDANFTNKVTEDTIVTGSMTLYAKFGSPTFKYLGEVKTYTANKASSIVTFFGTNRSYTETGANSNGACANSTGVNYQDYVNLVYTCKIRYYWSLTSLKDDVYYSNSSDVSDISNWTKLTRLDWQYDTWVDYHIAAIVYE